MGRKPSDRQQSIWEWSQTNTGEHVVITTNVKGLVSSAAQEKYISGSTDAPKNKSVIVEFRCIAVSLGLTPPACDIII